MNKHFCKSAISTLGMAILLCLLCACGTTDVNEGDTPSEHPEPTHTHQTEALSPEDTSSADPVFSATPTPEPTEPPVTQLPDPEAISAEETPLLYDFVYSCLDWHVSIHRDEYNSSLYILRHRSAPSILYTDYYEVQAGYTFPPVGSRIERHELSVEETTRFDAAAERLSESYIVRDGDWTLYIMGEGARQILQDTGITFWYAADYTYGNELPFLEDGSGWPTEWLRREPYVSLLKEEGLDMTDPWWDTWNYMGVYYMEPLSGPATYGRPKLTCLGVERFEYKSDNGIVEEMTWEDVQLDCAKTNYCIPGIYDPSVG